MLIHVRKYHEDPKKIKLKKKSEKKGTMAFLSKSNAHIKLDPLKGHRPGQSCISISFLWFAKTYVSILHVTDNSFDSWSSSLFAKIDISS